MAGETKVVQMRYPVDLLDAIDAARAVLGQTRTEFVLGAVRGRLGFVQIAAPDAGYSVEVDESDGAHNVAPPDSIAGARARSREVSPRFKK
jgi:hypothetical protein